MTRMHTTPGTSSALATKRETIFAGPRSGSGGQAGEEVCSPLPSLARSRRHIHTPPVASARRKSPGFDTGFPLLWLTGLGFRRSRLAIATSSSPLMREASSGLKGGSVHSETSASTCRNRNKRSQKRLGVLSPDNRARIPRLNQAAARNLKLVQRLHSERAELAPAGMRWISAVVIRIYDNNEHIVLRGVDMGDRGMGGLGAENFDICIRTNGKDRSIGAIDPGVGTIIHFPNGSGITIHRRAGSTVGLARPVSIPLRRITVRNNRPIRLNRNMIDVAGVGLVRHKLPAYCVPEAC